MFFLKVAVHKSMNNGVSYDGKIFVIIITLSSFIIIF